MKTNLNFLHAGILVSAFIFAPIHTGCGGGGIMPPIYSDVEGNVIVVIGDSIASHLDTDTFSQADPNFYFLGLFPTVTRDGDKVTILNTAMGGNRVTDIMRRFQRDCTNYDPGIAIINGGTNDLDWKMIDADAFIGAWSKMLDDCERKNIRAVVMGITPSTAFDTDQMKDRDEFNKRLKALTGSYDGFIYVDPDPYVGATRPGGPAGNMWDIDAEFSSPDGIHFNDEGYVELARAVLDAMRPFVQE